jgi:hypothetical protein
MAIIDRGPDGYFHPASEEELQALVIHARESKERSQLRVRGSGHSVARAIGTDGRDGCVDVMLDRYRDFSITEIPGDPDHALVEVEAGCNLGENPYDPTRTSTWQNSLNDNLQQAGWALDDLGGISHQTISGFLSTGSSGGSLTYGIGDALVRLRLIDGTGKIWDLSRDDPDPAARDMFFAAGVSMGLLGVISRVWLQARRSFNVSGSQVTSSVDAAAIDLFGDGDGERPGLERFLREAPYARLMWWPQRGFDRVQVWQAARMDPVPDFAPRPYRELDGNPELASLAGSLVYTILGNLDDVSVLPKKLAPLRARLEGEGTGSTVSSVLSFLRAGTVAGALTQLCEALLEGALDTRIAQLLARGVEAELPHLIHHILGPFVTDGSQTFWDTWMSGLPMDNQMDDELWPTTFTELWVPVERTAEVMRELRRFYEGGGDAATAYAHTGAFSCELYAAKASPFWMSSSYEADMFRVDVLWFSRNAGDPAEIYYPQFWELLQKFDLRPHWGKVLPPPTREWQEHYARCFPRLGEFLALRDRMDPRQIFVTDYWRAHLGIAPIG